MSPPAVLLLHGLPVDARIWEPVRRRLAAAGLPSVALDLPGYGRTPWPPGGLPDFDGSLADHATWLDARLHHAGLDPAGLVLVGHDYGGLLAADLAARRGCRGLVLSSTTLGLGWLPVRLSALPGIERLLYRAFGGTRWRDLGVPPEHRAQLAAAFPLGQPALPARMRAVAAGIDLRRADLAPHLRTAVPVCCLWGTDDRSVPPAAGRRLARKLDAAWVTVPGRHYAMWSHPDPWTAALARFVTAAQ